MGKYDKLFYDILSGRKDRSIRFSELTHLLSWRHWMNNYEIIVYWSADDNAFVAEVPELPGCMADGKTYTEAVQNAEIAITEWIETAELMGRSIPIARGKLAYA
jgi:predicted RNase H-like HicB family nuclease